MRAASIPNVLRLIVVATGCADGGILLLEAVMSHEGIRIVPAEQAAEETARDKARGYGGDLPKFPCRGGDAAEGAGEEDRGHGGRDRLARRASERVELSVAADWLSVRDLPRGARAQRAVAGRGQAEGPESVGAVPAAGASRWRCCRLGKYAIKFKWSDGHEGGIYSWDFLRRVCQCEACMAASRDLAERGTSDDAERE